MRHPYSNWKLAASIQSCLNTRTVSLIDSLDTSYTSPILKWPPYPLLQRECDECECRVQRECDDTDFHLTWCSRVLYPNDGLCKN